MNRLAIIFRYSSDRFEIAAKQTIFQMFEFENENQEGLWLSGSQRRLYVSSRLANAFRKWLSKSDRYEAIIKTMKTWRLILKMKTTNSQFHWRLTAGRLLSILLARTFRRVTKHRHKQRVKYQMLDHENESKSQRRLCLKWICRLSLTSRDCQKWRS